VRPLGEQTVLVTGSTDGLGRAVAAELAGRGADVLVHGRDPAKAEAVAAEIGAARFVVADLSSLEEVRRLAAETGEADTLVNNAGVAVLERRESTDGHELTFAVNYLSHFLLTGLLLENSLREPARIVNVASIGQAPIDFDDPMLERSYDRSRAYSQSKLAQISHAFELAERLGERDVTVNALHPATLMDTKLVRETYGAARTTIEEGMTATVRLAADPDLDAVTGRYFDGLAEARAHAQAYDPDARRRLWELSERLVAAA